MAQLVSIELKPLVKIRNWNRDCINPAKYSQTAHGSPSPIAPFVANFSMPCGPADGSYPDRPSAESKARTRRTRSIYGWFGGMASVLAGRVPVREVRERSIGFRWRRPQPVKGAVDRGSSDAEQLGEFGLGVGAERIPMIGRRQDVKKRRTSRRFVSLLRELDGAYVVRLGPFRALCRVELHALTFSERPETGRLDGAVVDKHISAAAVDFNEAEALLTTLDCCRTLDSANARAKLPGT